MPLQQKIKTALDDNRILILGAQILAGFQFQGAFRPTFDQLPAHAQALDVVALLLMVITIGLLIAPAMQHRIVERGSDTRRLLRAIGLMVRLALFPFALSLGLDLFIATERVLGFWAGLATGVFFVGLALFCWYGLELLMKQHQGHRERAMAAEEPEHEDTPLHAKIEHMLTETRVMLPGAQALLGFQLVIIFTEAFEKLPGPSKLVHMAGLACLAVTVVCLMVPATYHRIVYGGEDAEGMHVLGSRFVVAASAPLALGLACEVYVVVAKVAGSSSVGLAAALGIFAMLVGLWHLAPLALRGRRRVPPARDQAGAAERA